MITVENTQEENKNLKVLVKGSNQESTHLCFLMLIRCLAINHVFQNSHYSLIKDTTIQANIIKDWKGKKRTKEK